MRTLAVVTIGQTPRTDLTPELRELIPSVRLVERGALDGLGAAEILRMAPGPGDEVLTTRLRDGSAAVIGRAPLIARMQEAINDVQPEADVVLLACTGEFPAFTHTKPLIEPDHVLAHALAAVAQRSRRIGVISPLAEQQVSAAAKFAALLPAATTVLGAAATPYAADLAPLTTAARRLAQDGAEFIVLDCIGYTAAMRRQVGAAAGVPVLLARSVAARMAAELLG